MVLSNEQVFTSVAGGVAETEVTNAIKLADKLTERGRVNLHVVRTFAGEVCIYTEYQMAVARKTVQENIYSTEGGFVFNKAA